MIKNWLVGNRGTFGVILLLLLALTITAWGWDRAENKLEVVKTQRDNLQAEKAELLANLTIRNMSDAERVIDQEALAELEKELTDVLADIPDTKPSPARIALNCLRLKRAGFTFSELPLPCRSDGETETASDD